VNPDLVRKMAYRWRADGLLSVEGEPTEKGLAVFTFMTEKYLAEGLLALEDGQVVLTQAGVERFREFSD
jgi:hypothetical protein